jgi:hypothetical protein
MNASVVKALMQCNKIRYLLSFTFLTKLAAKEEFYSNTEADIIRIEKIP